MFKLSSEICTAFLSHPSGWSTLSLFYRLHLVSFSLPIPGGSVEPHQSWQSPPGELHWRSRRWDFMLRRTTEEVQGCSVTLQGLAGQQADSPAFPHSSPFPGIPRLAFCLLCALLAGL